MTHRSPRSIDQARLLPHLREPLGQPTPPATTPHPDPPPATRRTITIPTAGELRGIPVQGRGISGAIYGSRPSDVTR